MKEYDDKHYQEFEFDEKQVIRGMHPKMQAIQQRNIKKKNKALDDDVIDWISTQDSATRNYINGMIRNYMSFKNETIKAVS